MKKMLELLKCVSRRNILPLLILLFISNPFALKASVPGVNIAAPTALAATSVTSTSFRANWQSVNGAEYYKLYVYRWAGLMPITGQPLYMIVSGYDGRQVQGTNNTVAGLTAGLQYKYHVVAVGIQYEESDPSNSIFVTTAPASPVATDATNITPVSFTANWGAVTGATSYKFFMIDAAENYIHDGLSVTGTSFNATGLTPNSLYRYRVSAVNSSGESEKSNIITRTTSVATPPVAKNATSITTNSFTANWNAVAGATSYELWVLDATAGTIKVFGRQVETLSNSVTGLNPNNRYSYTVKAKFGATVSAESNLITVNTKPTPPVATAASSITTNSFNANWGAVDDATGYKLWVISSENTGNNPDGYFPKAIGNVTTHNLTGLTPGHSYTYYVQVVTSLGESTVSNSINVTTKPNAPAAMNASDLTSNSFRANWQTVIGASGYKLYVYRVSDQQWVPGYYGKTVSGTSEVISGLNPSTHYRYTVTTLMGGVESDHSNIINVNTLAAQPASYTLVLSSSPSGAGTLSGGGTFNQGTQVTANAAANAGYTFVNWTEGGIVVSTSPSYPFQINSNRNLVANFTQQAPKTYSVVVTPSHPNRGTVTGGGSYNNGSSVTVTATPSMKTYKFVNWTENGSIVSTDATYSFNITADRNLVANFDVNQTTQFTVDLAVSPSGAGTATGAGSFASGTSVTVTANPTAGYNFTGWSEDGVTVSTSVSYTFNITANRNLVANFAQQIQNYTLTTSVAPAGGGTSSIPSATYASGTSVTVTATPAAGYNFVNWTEGGTAVSTSASYTFNITANRNLVANFAQQIQNYTLTTSVAPAGGGTSSIPSATYASGTSVTVTAIPAAGYNFVNWTEGGTAVSTSASYTFNITANRNLVANFAQQAAQTYTISALVSPAAGGTVDLQSGTFEAGVSLIITATASEGYDFENWTEGENVVSTSPVYQFVVDASRNLTANFVLRNSIAEKELLKLTMYPNPASEWVMVAGIPQGASLKIVSIAGNILNTIRYEGESKLVDISALRRGTYFIMAENGYYSMVSKLMVVK
jgi:uncharacterized repeat protein (TIGR02543 family)